MATADLTVIALGRPDASASEYIAEIQRRLAEQDRVRYVMHAMGTSLEGATADILAVVGELHAVPFELGIPRVYTVLKLDERRDKRADARGQGRLRAASAQRRGIAAPRPAVPFRLYAAPASHLRHDPLNGFRADAPGSAPSRCPFCELMWRSPVVCNSRLRACLRSTAASGWSHPN